MTTNKKIITSISIATIAMMIFAALPAFAQMGVGINAGVGVNTGGYGVTGRSRMMASTTGVYASSSVRLGGGMMGAGISNRGSMMVDQRIASLGKLSERIQNMKNLSDAQKSSFAAEIQTEITALTDLKTKLSADTSTTTRRADLQSITKSFRIYALIEPQINIISAADRAQTTVTMMNTIGTKLQTRLSASSTLSASTTASAQASLTDFTAKLADANIQAQAAVTDVAALKPDNGDQNIFTSNQTALKDARTKIQAAQKDIVAARKDAQSIVKLLAK